jgi:hypothetical protein
MRKAFIAAIAVLLSAPALSTTLIENARGIQIGPDGKIDRFRGLVVNDQGKVVQVLRGPGAPACPSTSASTPAEERCCPALSTHTAT